jgi:predicted RNase H-like nuclease (RuvC/YqgF family)
VCSTQYETLYMNNVDELISTLACKRHEEHELGKKLECLEHELRSEGWAHDEAIGQLSEENAELRKDNDERRRVEQQLTNRIAILEAANSQRK